MRISKTCSKQPFSHSKWGLQAIVSLTVLSNCVSVSSDTAFVADCTNSCTKTFFKLLKSISSVFKTIFNLCWVDFGSLNVITQLFRKQSSKSCSRSQISWNILMKFSWNVCVFQNLLKQLQKAPISKFS